ncbi:hypothetical protein A3D25_00435 [Candidatus Daviesbacteria bacterium RIFCSPHIGHO2_02_FULL_43_12]|uniref:SpoVT-AbrB domain-containing protein n=1 Tax=Candidatus Daviesbacteria bacterium RIFCSPHIGHO2_02_FULL_43_12 TaxID=1797776 RepID=A0A1F5KIZ1_9BACT|nr:MAG: hypothetical protein A3D25_00435 [Candidatus Daviesbacteria bacterium RIFCSPHIGHO2_02_FULL_43_12]OGE40912.1 MAG: hypothetical protein A3E86_05480 [Candidatus Daviesbacteria bacterium RIFCSPHIGHO2_12_FULL_47_45]OGE70131.1 MAG: hypothetical protein A3B55_00205 [Candidatus Daviesbacteria bacterium RIFCSPLOWO2_01_FULL_43_15]
MSQLATITSKKQLTLPAELFRKVGFKVGQKVVVMEENGSLKISSSERLVEELAGSVPMPKEWEGRDLDQVIDQSVAVYIQEKYQVK